MLELYHRLSQKIIWLEIMENLINRYLNIWGPYEALSYWLRALLWGPCRLYIFGGYYLPRNPCFSCCTWILRRGYHHLRPCRSTALLQSWTLTGFYTERSSLHLCLLYASSQTSLSSMCLSRRNHSFDKYYFKVLFK